MSVIFRIGVSFDSCLRTPYVYRANTMPSTIACAAISGDRAIVLLKWKPRWSCVRVARPYAAAASRSAAVLASAASPIPTATIIGPSPRGSASVEPTLPVNPAAVSRWRSNPRSAGLAPVVVIVTPTAVTPAAGDRATDTSTRAAVSRDGVGEKAALAVVVAMVLCSCVLGFDHHQFGSARTVNRLRQCLRLFKERQSRTRPVAAPARYP